MINDKELEHEILQPDSIVVQTTDLALRTIADWVEKGKVDIAPDFQRRDRWKPDKQAALIESLLLNLPIPPVFLSEDNTGKFSVIDGRQRLTAIHAFFYGELTLSKLEELPELNGVSFEKLDESLQDYLEMRPLRTVTLLKQTNPVAKYLLFKRLNTGGERLNPQEIRNVAFRGKLNSLLITLSENQFFRQQFKIADDQSSAMYRKMQDVELVLRFFTLKETWRNFAGDFSKSMDNFMLRHQNPNSEKLRAFEKSFCDVISEVERLFGSHAFHRPEGDGWREQALTPLYDAEMVAVAEVGVENLRVLPNLAGLRIIRELFEDESFASSVRTGTNTTSKVQHRIEALSSKLAEASWE